MSSTNSRLTRDLLLPKDVLARYLFIFLFPSGGSAGKTFLVKDKSGKQYILKYADWDGIGYNGAPWLERQAERFIELKKQIPNPGKQLLPTVYEFNKIKKVFYFVYEYFEHSQTLSQYYLDFEGKLIENYLSDINYLITILSSCFYSQGYLKTPSNYIKNTHIKRVRYRLSLLIDTKSETYRRYLKDKQFVLGEFTHQDMSDFFKNLLKQKTIVINGKKYRNVFSLLSALESNTKLLQYLTPTAVLKYAHGDSLLRNYMKLSDGNLKIIDVRGVNLPNNTISRVCIPFELGKMLHSIGMDVVRSENYLLKVKKRNDTSIEFQFGYLRDKKNITQLLAVREEMPSLFANNKALVKLLAKEPHWQEKMLLAEACHFLSDAVNRLVQDSRGHHTLAYYVVGTILLNQFMEKHTALL